MTTISLPFNLDEVIERTIQTEVAKRVEVLLASSEVADPWLTVPEAAAYMRITEPHMRLLVNGRHHKEGTNGKPSREAVAAKIPSGDVGHSKGRRVRRSACDAYLERHAQKGRLRRA